MDCWNTGFLRNWTVALRPCWLRIKRADPVGDACRGTNYRQFRNDGRLPADDHKSRKHSIHRLSPKKPCTFAGPDRQSACSILELRPESHRSFDLAQ